MGAEFSKLYESDSEPSTSNPIENATEPYSHASTSKSPKVVIVFFNVQVC